MISNPDKMSFKLPVKSASLEENVFCLFSNFPPNKLGMRNMIAIATITHIVTIISK